MRIIVFSCLHSLSLDFTPKHVKEWTCLMFALVSLCTLATDVHKKRQSSKSVGVDEMAWSLNGQAIWNMQVAVIQWIHWGWRVTLKVIKTRSFTKENKWNVDTTTHASCINHTHMTFEDVSWARSHRNEWNFHSMQIVINDCERESSLQWTASFHQFSCFNFTKFLFYERKATWVSESLMVWMLKWIFHQANRKLRMQLNHRRCLVIAQQLDACWFRDITVSLVNDSVCQRRAGGEFVIVSWEADQ